MAGMNTSSSTVRRTLAAERIAGYGAEQRRLKAAAAHRRAAAAARAAEATEKSTFVVPARAPTAERPSQYLR